MCNIADVTKMLMPNAAARLDKMPPKMLILRMPRKLQVRPFPKVEIVGQLVLNHEESNHRAGRARISRTGPGRASSY